MGINTWSHIWNFKPVARSKPQKASIYLYLYRTELIMVTWMAGPEVARRPEGHSWPVSQTVLSPDSRASEFSRAPFQVGPMHPLSQRVSNGLWSGCPWSIANRTPLQTWSVKALHSSNIPGPSCLGHLAGLPSTTWGSPDWTTQTGWSRYIYL